MFMRTLIQSKVAENITQSAKYIYSRSPSEIDNSTFKSAIQEEKNFSNNH